MTVCVSVVIPTFRRHELLLRCLRALERQDYPHDSLEVLVCDDAASLDTESVVAHFAHGSTLSVRYNPVLNQHGPAAARNVGWRNAHHEVIAFTDDDTIPSENWISEGVRALSECGAVAGRVIVPLSHAPTDYELNESGLDGAEFVTANCFCRREVLTLLGGFDENFTAAWREDSDLYFRILHLAKSRPDLAVVRSDRVRVVHPVRPAGWGVSLKQQRKTMFDALLYRKHPTLYRTKISPRPPWHYYFGVATAALGAIALVYGFYACALGFIGVWCLVTARFCFRRLRRTTKRPSHIAEMVITSALIPFLSIYWRLRGAYRFRSAFM